mgnify:CR=1 FL=1
MATGTGTRMVQFRAGDLLPEIEARAGRLSIGLTARRDLERYYALLDAELARLELSEAEAGLVMDALNGTLFEPHGLGQLWAEVAVAIHYGDLGTKHGVDTAALIDKLRSLTPGQAAAMVDAAARFWQSPNPTGEALRRVGLVREPAESPA